MIEIELEQLTPLERQVDEAAYLSIVATNEETRRLASHKRKEAYEAVLMAVLNCGRLISILRQFPMD